MRDAEREAIFDNLLSGESEYFADLQLLVTNYAQPLRETPATYGLTKDTVERIFGPITQIRDFHDIFYNMLTNTKSILEIFWKMIRTFYLFLRFSSFFHVCSPLFHVCSPLTVFTS